jgi:uncharacterized RDD family membrane protein YckC
METEKYRTGFKRLLAAIVDGIVFLPFLLVDRWLIKTTANDYVLMTWLSLTAFIPIFYSIILHYKFGQTIGKWVAGVKVLDVSENRNINFKQSFIRDAVYLLFEIIGFLYFFILVVKTGDTHYMLDGFNGFAATPFFIWTLLEIITMLTNNKRRAIHDFIAKSVVVKM